MELGTNLKHYRILSRIGEGGMGVVYQAEDTRLGRTVALKVLPDELADSRDHLRRFEREARAASSISHPGVATLYDFDREGSTTFLTMEFVEGKTLRQVLDEDPLPFPKLLDCLIQVAVALEAAHLKGVIHRDLKPENVMAADSGFYKILDFGLARIEMREDAGFSSSPTQWATVSRQMTNEGKIVGTFAYMSPEQVQGHTLDARSDIFSFGVVLHELVTGALPFQGNNAIASFHAIVHEAPGPMSLRRPDAPPELERIALKCLAKDPDERYQTAGDLALDLRSLLRDSDPSGAGYYSSPAYAIPRRRSPRRRGLVWLLAAAAGAVIVAGLVLAIRVGTRPAGPPAGVPAAPGLMESGGSSEPFATDAVGTLHNRIAVTAFSNVSGDADADWLRHALPEMLTTDLARSRQLEVISTQRMNDLVAASGRGQEDSLDQATATELARWAGAGIVVSGSIFKSGDGYRIDVQASDTLSGKVINANRVEGGDIFEMADRLAADLRQGLQIDTVGEKGIENLTTSSAVAYRHFTAGMQLYQHLRLAEAAAAFRRAVQADPDFALAQLRLGMDLYLNGQEEEGLEWIDKAWAQAERLPERERLLAEGLDLSLQGDDLEAGTQRFRELAQRYPKDIEGLFWSARAQAALHGDQRNAVRTLQEALGRDPDSSLLVAGMAAYLRGLQHTDDAESIVQDFLARHPEVSAEKLELEAHRLQEPFVAPER